MPRGIREVKHTRVLFGDLGYAPDQNPYKPDGIRKMSDTWINPDGDGYVSMIPGYTSVVDLGDDTITVKGLGVSKHGETTLYWAHTVDSGLNNEIWKLSDISSTGTVTAALALTMAGAGSGRQFAGRMPMYAFTDSSTNRAYFFSGSQGSATAIGGYYDQSDQSTGTIGLARPDVTSSASAAGAGSGTAVKGVVKYFVSYTGQYGTDEGALSLEFGEIDAGDGDDIDLSALPTDSTNKRRLYRTFSDGNQPFYLATLNSSDTTYTDNIADVDLGDLPLQMGDPPDENFAYIAATWHFGRAYILGINGDTGEQRIYFCDPDEPESYYTSQFGNWFSIYDGSPLKVLSRIPTGLVILKARAAYFLRGRTPADFTLHEIVPQSPTSWSVGCGAPGSAIETPKGLFFYDALNYSVWALSANGEIRNISEPIRNDLRGSTATGLVDEGREYNLHVHVGYQPSSDVVMVSNGSATSGQQAMWLFNVSTGRWIGKATYSPTGTIPVLDNQNESFGTLASFLSTGSGGAESDNIYKIFSGTDHGGTAISAPTVGSPTFTGSDPTLEKTFLYVDVLMKGEASKSVTVNWFIDGATTADGTATVSLTGTDARERHRVNIGERGRELDIDIVLDNSSISHGIYGLVYGYTEDTSVVGS